MPKIMCITKISEEMLDHVAEGKFSLPDYIIDDYRSSLERLIRKLLGEAAVAKVKPTVWLRESVFCPWEEPVLVDEGKEIKVSIVSDPPPSKPLEWTREKPVANGLYWARKRWGPNVARFNTHLVEIFNGRVLGLYGAEGGAGDPDFLFWMGPLPFPEPPREETK